MTAEAKYLLLWRVTADTVYRFDVESDRRRGLEDEDAVYKTS